MRRRAADKDGYIGDRVLEENCGIFGVVGRENASRIVFFALYALNHREYAEFLLLACLRFPSPVMRCILTFAMAVSTGLGLAGGQESAGLASYDRMGIHVHKGMGLVSQVFDEHDIETLKGCMAIGHTRYSTAGGSKLSGAQPFVLETDLGQLAIAHNGQVRGGCNYAVPLWILPLTSSAYAPLLPSSRRWLSKWRCGKLC